MFYYSRSNRQGVVLLALVFLLIQVYVLYSSTSHVFHNSMPMCPICVAMKSYQGGDVDSSTFSVSIVTFPVCVLYVKPQWLVVDWFVYDSRAPPTFSNK